VRQAEVAELTAVLELAAGRQPDPDPQAQAQAQAGASGMIADRMLAAFEHGRMIGGTSSVPREVTVPGGAMLAAAKVGLTGVLPGYRGSGISSEMMRRQLTDLRSRDEPLAILTTAQSSVPARHGFCTATTAMAARFTPRSRYGAGSRPDGMVRLIGRAEASRILPAVFDAHRPLRPGQVSRPADFWDGWLADPPLTRISGGDRFVVLAERDDGTAEGYLSYRLMPGVLREQPVRELVIEELITVSDSARRRLWSLCGDFDQASAVSAWNLPRDEPLAWIVPDERGLAVTGLRPFLRVRLLDVAAALAARRYAAAGSVVLEVADPLLEGNARRYLLTGGPDGAAVTGTTAAAELALPVGALGSAYLGGTTLTSLAQAGLVDELAPGALRRADAMFGWHQAPWTVTDW
jgi:predicted acetyltransferase